MINKIKQIIKNLLINDFQIPSIEKSLEHLNSKGFYPDTIYDIGAYKGDFTMLCRRIWSNSQIVCFEPLSSQIPILKDISQKHKNIFVIEGLVGEEKKIVEFNEAETASSCLKEHNNQEFKLTQKQMNTLDNFVLDFKLYPPNFLKIDTQGYEFQILQGASNLLWNIDVILVELNFMDIHKEVCLADEVILFLKGFDFVLYDIAEIHRRPLDNLIWQTDFIFVKKDSFLRKDKKWG